MSDQPSPNLIQTYGPPPGSKPVVPTAGPVESSYDPASLTAKYGPPPGGTSKTASAPSGNARLAAFKQAASASGSSLDAGSMLKTGVRAVVDPMGTALQPLANSVAGKLPAVGEGIKKSFDSTYTGAEKVAFDYGKGDISLPSAVLQEAGNAAGGAVGAAAAAVEPFVPKSVKDVAGAGVKAIANTPVAQALGKAWADFSEAHPEAAGDLGAIGNLVSTLLPVGPGAKLAERGFSTAVDATENAVSRVGAKTVELGTQGATKAKELAEPSVVKSVAADWTRQIKNNNAAREVVEKAQAKGHDVSTFLAENGVDPYALNESTGMATADKAAEFRAQGGKASREWLNPLLEQVQQGTPRIKIGDIQKRAVSLAKEAQGRTPEQKATLIRNINSAFSDSSEGSLLDKYGSDISLRDMNNEKSSYWANTKFNGTAGEVDELSKQANFVKGEALKQLIEEKVEQATGGAIDVKSINEATQRYYEAADFLDAVGAKPIKLSRVRQAVSQAVRVAGGTAGFKIGGIFGGAGGYFGASALGRTIAELPLPSRTIVLRNLKASNIEAYQTVQKYLGEEATARATRMGLPAPKTIYAGPTQEGKPYTPNQRYGTTPVVETKQP